MIRASITAHSVAVGPSSDRRKLFARFSNAFMTLLLSKKGPNDRPEVKLKVVPG
jgi:hypothetical protein